ncbi:MAG TPA: hypothetical protein VL359_00120, partial [bacterium]|nr:hypothetical protein [bacterium]
MLRACVLAAALCVLGTLAAWAQAPAAGQAGALILDQPGLSVRSRVDWTGGELDVEITQALDPAQAALPRAKADAETDIQA